MTRKEKIASFRVVRISRPPLTSFIPVNDERRDRLYNHNCYDTYDIPDYSSFSRRNLKREDLYLLERRWWIVFSYCGEAYTLIVEPGAVYDVASVPKAFVHGGLTKRGQSIQEAALTVCLRFILVSLLTMPTTSLEL